MKPAFEPLPDGIRLHLRVTPNAGLDRIDGFETRDDGATVLRVRVKAVPDKGKANAAVVGLLAKTLGVPKSAVSLISGDTARLKTLHVSGTPDDLVAALARLA